MTDLRPRLVEAADYLEQLHEAAAHIPEDQVQHEVKGMVVTEHGAVRELVAQFFFGGAVEVWMTLGPAALPIVAGWLRTEARITASDEVHDGNCRNGTCTTVSALALADHILKVKEKQT